MGQEIDSLLTGLTNGINQYLGLRNEYGIKSALETQKQDAELQKGLKLKQEEAKLDLASKSALKLYEQTLAGKVDPETAAGIHPEAAQIVESFNKKNGRYPTVDEAKSLFGDLNKKEEKSANRDQRLNSTILQYTEALEKNPIHRKMQEQGLALDQLQSMADLAKSGNTVASSAMGVKAARAMGEVGVLTESDISRYVQSGQLARSAGDKLSKWVNGRPTNATIDEISQISNVLKDSFAQKVQPIYDRYVNRLSTNMGLSTEEAAQRLDVPYSGRIKGQPSQSDSTTIQQTAQPKPPEVGTVYKGYKFLGGDPSNPKSWGKL